MPANPMTTPETLEQVLDGANLKGKLLDWQVVLLRETLTPWAQAIREDERRKVLEEVSDELPEIPEGFWRQFTLTVGDPR